VIFFKEFRTGQHTVYALTAPQGAALLRITCCLRNVDGKRMSPRLGNFSPLTNINRANNKKPNLVGWAFI
jgi:hypothetical protein